MASAGSTSALPPRIDVHSHFLPPSYQAACRANGHANPDGMPYLPDWSPEDHLALMDKLGIAKSILSVSSPGCHLVPGDDALGRTVARECNAYAADLKKRLPTRFGYFASLPLPDVQGCLDELARAADEGCDGYVFMTNAHGYYLGDARFDAVFDELNRRKALVFIHPSTPRCPCAAAAGAAPTAAAPDAAGAVPATPLAQHWPNPMLEFFFDTARVVSNLFMSGTMRRCPDLRIILPHLGGAFPPLLSRWTGFSELVPGPWQGVPESEVQQAFRDRIWFDLAGFVFPTQIRGLLHGTGVSPSRLLYGSDYPFTRAPGVEMLAAQMDQGVRELFDDDDGATIAAVYHGNAARLLGLEGQ